VKIRIEVPMNREDRHLVRASAKWILESEITKLRAGAACTRSDCNRKCGLKDRILKNLNEIYEKGFLKGFIGF
jgi:hypothetical protein